MSREERHSVWSEYSKTMEFPALSENKSTDVLIIGGGIAGILCAYKLKNDCMLAEAGEICGGITQNTTADAGGSLKPLPENIIQTQKMSADGQRRTA